ncbi:FG-GAP repeat domain-containing protein [Streptomyces sp. NPDC056169]|uniref:FG-GAP repeat domain-containing protein n=1 Tax=Streptomyces sp. NPDC056169 TaxID=3345734 RepID=UPI0035D6FCF1
MGDLLARDHDGVLWLYLGKGDGTFAPRTRVGGGWGTYDRIVNIRDVDRDGRSDPIAESGTEEYALLTVYKSTGNWKAPSAPARSSAPAPRTRTACTVALSGGPTRHKEGETEVYTWTRYADGIRTRLAGGKYGADPGTDTVVRTDGTTRTFLDMATGEELVFVRPRRARRGRRHRLRRVPGDHARRGTKGGRERGGPPDRQGRPGPGRGPEGDRPAGDLVVAG